MGCISCFSMKNLVYLPPLTVIKQMILLPRYELRSNATIPMNREYNQAPHPTGEYG